MTTSTLRLVLSLLLLAAGLVSWAAAGVAADLSSRYERIATLENLRPPVPTRWTAALEAVVDPGRPVPPSTVSYWRGDYTAASADPPSSTADLLVAANAMFRQVQAEAGAGLMSIDRLDRTLQAYAAVLKNAGFSRAAAFNYEFVARTRDTVARSRPAPVRRSPPPAPAVTPDDLPAGPTIHGRPGMHPPNTRGEEFDVLTPMDYGEREAQPEPTPGRPLPRKG